MKTILKLLAPYLAVAIFWCLCSNAWLAILEQLHWSQLREQTGWSHLCFAGYHVLVLYSLLTLPWLLLCLVVLLAASLCWKQLERATRSLTVPVVSHVLADLGVVLAAWTRTH
jgi:hypothetical protein